MRKRIVEIMSATQRIFVGDGEFVFMKRNDFDDLISYSQEAYNFQTEAEYLRGKLHRYNETMQIRNGTSLTEKRILNPEDLLTSQEVAGEWGISVKALEKWRLSGEGPPFVKLGNGRCATVRYRRRDISKYVDDHQREHTTQHAAAMARQGRRQRK